MQTYIEVTGKTDEEALAKGLAQLGLDRDDVSVEILERGKAGFLGIGSIPARVKITYEGPDEPQRSAPVKEERPVPEAKPAPKPEQPGKSERPKAEKPKTERSAAERPKPASEPKPAPAQPVGEDDEIAGAIRAFQVGLFAHMGVEATPVITKRDDAYQVVLEGSDMGALIGRRGETLDAIQQLTGYAVNKGRGKRARIHVDAEGYRARREESLQRLAKKTAAKVVKYRRSVTLEAMNAYERHVIHAALQEYPGVTTYSTGTEPNRRTVVAYDPSRQ